MRGKILAGAAASVAALSLSILPAGAGSTSPTPFLCNTTINGGTIKTSVEVPANGVCVLNGVAVNGGVTADSNSYFESNGSSISGNVAGNAALTLYVRNKSAVAGSVANYKGAQVFVYDSSIAGSVGAASFVAPGYGHFQVCGSRISDSVAAYQVGPDILVGDPVMSCGANTVNGSGIFATYNTTDSELYVIGNSMPNGGLQVTSNTGVGDKRVNANSLPLGTLNCSGNSSPFDGSHNVAAHKVTGGQCTVG